MTSELTNLVDQTVTDIRTVLHRFGAPVVMSSFGKDSLAMLFCLREASLNLPVIYLRDPWQPEKHAQADEVIRKMGLTVHNWPPTGMGIKFKDDRLEFVARYQFGSKSCLDIPKNIEPQLPRQRLLCGLYDIIRRPIATFRHGWDVILLGHKNSDKDQYYGNVPLHLDVKITQFGEPALYFPMREWSDDNIWELIESEHLSYQKNRYEDRHELADKTFNNDYVQCCSKCLDPRNGETVFCPRFGKEINNMSQLVPHFDEKFDYFGERKEDK